MQKLLKYIILIGIFTLPLINSRITTLLGFSFSDPVEGNYEFTKVMFFNIWSSLVISLFFINSLVSPHLASPKRRVIIGIFFFYIILLISTIFSETPINSFLGNGEKSHSFLMWSNLVGLYIVFSSLFFTPNPPLKGAINSPLQRWARGGIFFQQIIKTFIFSGIFVSLIGLKEYFFPTFDYGELGNRLFSTFGHPNYLSIFLVGLILFLYQNLSSSLKSAFLKCRNYLLLLFIIILFIITLILTKSFIAIFLFILFNIYYFFYKKTNKNIFFILIFFILIFGFILIYIFIPEKLYSFVSRFFIWETTIRIIFSHIKIFLIGGGADTLTLFFNNFKSEYIYIFENLGYTADRPHNIILNFFYHFGIGGLIFILAIYYKVFKNIKSLLLKSDGVSRLALVLILIFLLFNPTSITIYLFITILLANLFLEKSSTKLPLYLEKRENSRVSFYLLIFYFFITFTSIFGAYFSFKHYISETYFYKNNFIKALELYKFNPDFYLIKGDLDTGLKLLGTKTQLYYKYKIRSLGINTQKGVDKILEFLDKYNYPENYFYIGNLFWNNKQEELAKKYYKKGLKKLPDLWNSDSKYYDKFIVKKLKIDDHRLVSKRYGLAKILERVGIR